MYLMIFGKPRYLGLVEIDDEESFEKGESLLIETPRGMEVAVVAGEITDRQEALYRSIDNRQEGQGGNDSALQNVAYIRRAEPEDLKREQDNRREEEGILITARQVLSRHALELKLVDVEYLNDRKKLFLYFTSEQRVDFRAFVRDLAREFKTRIELRQIGVRDESKVVKGLGTCGRPCCCSYWLQRFMPIGIKMVKEQNLALNPTKISGLCGRLMCCMSFEQETYHELWKKLPPHGTKIKTEQGTWVLSGVDLATQTCNLRGPGTTVNIPIACYRHFKETVLAGKEWNNEAHDIDSAAEHDENANRSENSVAVPQKSAAPENISSASPSATGSTGSASDAQHARSKKNGRDPQKAFRRSSNRSGRRDNSPSRDNSSRDNLPSDEKREQRARAASHAAQRNKSLPLNPESNQPASETNSLAEKA